MKALIDKGLLKVNNFRNSTNKRAYLYLLTPRGIEEKAVVTARFLRMKLDEHETLKRELEELQRLAHHHLVRLADEVLVGGTAVHGELAGTRRNPDARDCGLALARGVELCLGHRWARCQ